MIQHENQYYLLVVSGPVKNQTISMIDKETKKEVYKDTASHIDTDNIEFTFNWIILELLKTSLESLHVSEPSYHLGPPEPSLPDTMPTIPFTK